MEKTEAVCAMLGITINTAKCYKMVVKTAGARFREREGLPGVTLARSIRYLEVDLLSSRVGPRVVADRRAADFVDRCRFASLSHWTQRSSLLADTMAANWLSAGSNVTQHCASKMVSAAAVALLGSQNSRARLKGNRAILHLTGPGIHSTHNSVSSAYEASRMLFPLLLMRVWSPEEWGHMWISRNVATCGLLRSVTWAVRDLSINWDAPFRWSCGSRQLDLSVPQQLLDRSDRETFRKHMRDHEIQRKLHDVREFLRFVVATSEAVRLPYLYAGLEDGWMEDTQIRRSTHCLRHLCAGPALLSGAIWTELDESRRNWRASGTCCRCDQEADTLTHCLW